MHKKQLLLLLIAGSILVLIFFCFYFASENPKPPLVVEGLEAEKLLGECIAAAKNKDRRYFKQHKNTRLILPMAMFLEPWRRVKLTEAELLNSEDILKNKRIFDGMAPIENNDPQALHFLMPYKRYTEELIHEPYLDDAGWVCAKLMVTPEYINDPKTIMSVGDLIFNVDQDAPIGKGENCEQLIQYGLIRFMKLELDSLESQCTGWDSVERGELDSFFESKIDEANKMIAKIYGNIDIKLSVKWERNDERLVYTARAYSLNSKVSVSYTSDDVRFSINKSGKRYSVIDRFSVRFTDMQQVYHTQFSN